MTMNDNHFGSLILDHHLYNTVLLLDLKSQKSGMMSDCLKFTENV